MQLPAISHKLCFIILVIILNSNIASARISEFYQSGSIDPQQALDIYSRDRFVNAPIMVYIHGGAWIRGDKRQVNSKPDFFNKLGFVFVSINYRLIPTVTIEEQLLDIDLALGWIKKHIGNYGGDPKNIHLMGHSAGAHLACLSAISPRENMLKMIRDTNIRSVICNDTMTYDIVTIARFSGGVLHRIYERVFSNMPENWEKYSPMHHPLPSKNMPSFMLIHSGKKMARVRKQLTQKFATHLRENRIFVTLFDAKDYSHRQVTVDIGIDNGLTTSLIWFLNELARKTE